MNLVKKALFWLKRRTLLIYVFQSFTTVAVCLVIAIVLEELFQFSYGYIVMIESAICFLVMYFTKDRRMLESFDTVKKLESKYENEIYDHLQSSNLDYLGLSGFLLMLVGYYNIYL